MTAERGAVFGPPSDDLSPEIEAQFLKNVEQFEESYDKSPLTTDEVIGSPAYKKPMN